MEFESTGDDRFGRLVSPVNFTDGSEFGNPNTFANDLNGMREWGWSGGLFLFFRVIFYNYKLFLFLGLPLDTR